MENTPEQTPPKSNRPNIWIRTGLKALIFLAVAYVFHLFMLRIESGSWKSLSIRAGQFAENMMTGAARLSPMNLWKSISGDQKTHDLESSPYIPGSTEVAKLTIPDKIATWLGYYWYTDKGNTFWVGRLILILAALAALGIAMEDYQKNNNKLSALALFPFNVFLKFFILLLSIGLIAILFYFITQLLLEIFGGVVTLLTFPVGCGGLIQCLVHEVRNDVTDGAKKTLGGYVYSFLFGRNSPRK